MCSFIALKKHLIPLHTHLQNLVTCLPIALKHLQTVLYTHLTPLQYQVQNLEIYSPTAVHTHRTPLPIQHKKLQICLPKKLRHYQIFLHHHLMQAVILSQTQHKHVVNWFQTHLIPRPTQLKNL